MASTNTVTLNGQKIDIKIIRHHNSKSIRMHVNSDGIVVVTIPKRAPAYLVRQALSRNARWINTQLEQRRLSPTTVLKPGTKIGKYHSLNFKMIAKLNRPMISITDSQAIVKLPLDLSWDSTETQTQAKKAIIKTLRQEASQYLPKRLEQLATKYNFSYNSVSIRKLERRWGSCSSRQDITFNLRLMSLPYELIDYVIIHELVHTIYPHHQAAFWQKVMEIIPNYKELRSQIRKYHS